jgi:hypothetical protein
VEGVLVRHGEVRVKYCRRAAGFGVRERGVTECACVRVYASVGSGASEAL